MGDTNHQHFNGNVSAVNGISVEHQTKVEIHQHFFTELDRTKLHAELMAFQKTDPEFFQALQKICTAMHGDFMFVKLNDAQFKAFYEIKNILFSFYQDKETHRLSLSEEKANVTKLQMDLAVERNRVVLFQKEVEQANNRGLGKIFKKFFGTK